MSKISDTLFKSKFRGCLLGTLVGDCFGAPFVGDTYMPSSKIVLQRYFDKLDGPYFKAPVKKCTKDTIMTKCVAQTLIDEPANLNSTKLAKLLVKEYFTDPKRGYGEGISTIFHKLRANKFTDPFKPALEQTGSFDNGAAVRSAPIGLFHHDNYKMMMETSKTVAGITHTHKHGVSGALLHSIAVRQSLLTDPSENLDAKLFLTELMTKLKVAEIDEEGLGIGHPSPFTSQMEIVQELLEKGTSTTDEEVVELLGHSVLAIYSVPTAIYCLLKSQSDVEDIQTSNLFRRTLQYAISLGGDTATIAGLAGGLAGALYGDDKIGKNMLQHCEYSQDVTKIADQLYNVKFNK